MFSGYHTFNGIDLVLKGFPDRNMKFRIFSIGGKKEVQPNPETKNFSVSNESTSTESSEIHLTKDKDNFFSNNSSDSPETPDALST
jgi:hypothetical protein